jgi:hypothetical protein
MKQLPSYSATVKISAAVSLSSGNVADAIATEVFQA